MTRVLYVLSVISVFSACSMSSGIHGSVDLQTAIRTLPANAVAGMSRDGREEYLESTPGEFDEENRRVHFFNDNSYEGGDAEAMFYLRLFEDANGRTIAASHSARPFADGSDPISSNTSVYRLENSKWKDVTELVMPSEIPRDWYFLFNEEDVSVFCGPYVRYDRVDGRGSAYRFGEATVSLIWENGTFRINDGD